MEQLINDIIQHIIQLITPFIRKLAKHLILTILLVLYLVAFWFLFFTKGIYVDGHFYKKGANLTTITYTSSSPFAEYKTITLQKQKDSSVITVDDDYVLTVNSEGSVYLENGTFAEDTLPDAQWDKIADQSAECNRGFGSKWWIFTLIVMAASVFVKLKSTEVYSFFFRNRAAGEGYYKAVDRFYKIIIPLGLLYLIIPI